MATTPSFVTPEDTQRADEQFSRTLAERNAQTESLVRSGEELAQQMARDHEAEKQKQETMQAVGRQIRRQQALSKAPGQEDDSYKEEVAALTKRLVSPDSHYSIDLGDNVGVLHVPKAVPFDTLHELSKTAYDAATAQQEEVRRAMEDALGGDTKAQIEALVAPMTTPSVAELKKTETEAIPITAPAEDGTPNTHIIEVTVPKYIPVQGAPPQQPQPNPGAAPAVKGGIF